VFMGWAELGVASRIGATSSGPLSQAIRPQGDSWESTVAYIRGAPIRPGARLGAVAGISAWRPSWRRSLLRSLLAATWSTT
jgi:hypothetical protein